MDYLKTFILAVMVVFMNVSCSLKPDSKEQENKVLVKSDKVELYYFHYTRRCATCNEVERISKEALNEYYGDKVNFMDYNLDETDGEAKGKSLNVSGQTLMIVAGEKHINITTEAFMNARSNPGKLKALIKEKIDQLL